MKSAVCGERIGSCSKKSKFGPIAQIRTYLAALLYQARASDPPPWPTSIQHFKRSWKILELKVARIWGFLGLNKSPQPSYCTRKIFRLKRVVEQSYSLNFFLMSSSFNTVYISFQRENRYSKKGMQPGFLWLMGKEMTHVMSPSKDLGQNNGWKLLQPFYWSHFKPYLHFKKTIITLECESILIKSCSHMRFFGFKQISTAWLLHL